MNPSIFFVLDDEDDRFLLSLAFADSNQRKLIRFFPDSLSMIYDLDNLNFQQLPDLIGLNYPLLGNKSLSTLALLKNHPAWQHIPIVLFCHTISFRLKQQLLKAGVAACLEKASYYVDYRVLRRALIALTKAQPIDEKIA